MVSVRLQAHLDREGQIDLERWAGGLPNLVPGSSSAMLVKAAERVRELRGGPVRENPDWATSADCFLAGLDIALILSELGVSSDCLVAGVLYRAVREERLSIDEAESEFGPSVAALLRGVLRMAAINNMALYRGTGITQNDTQSDNIRKMLIALVDDVQVALIKLAERTCAIRAVKEDDERRENVAREVFDIYAPLAHRLGIGQLKWELEDLSFRYLHPDAYRKIARLLDGKRRERDRFIKDVTARLRQMLEDAGLEFEITGRAKHIYSIWRKMQRKGIGFSQVYDIRALRILVPEIRDCYTTLGLVHSLWRSIPNEFDDYIANPKENGYRSLHTALIGPEGKIVEVQIRTFQMHEEAELGVCAHWRYKGYDGKRSKPVNSYEEKIRWLRGVLDWRDETGPGERRITFDFAQDRVYVFTPRGDVVSLAQGATALDFAYAIHTEVGHRCRGAKVDGNIVPLTQPLVTGQRIEILTGQENRPRRDWLQADLGYLKTPRARAKVAQWFKAQAREQNIAAGRSLLERQFRRLALTSIDYRLIARKVQLATVDDMYAAVGAGDLSSAQVITAAQSLVAAQPEPELRIEETRSTRGQSVPVEVTGVGNLLTHLAGCCKPLPGDAITGFITRGRGVTVHRSDCARLLALQYDKPERIIEVDWGKSPQLTYVADIAVEAYDRQGLLRDITTLFANERANVLSVNTSTDKSTHTARMRLSVEVADLAALSRLLERINRLKNIISAERLM